MEPHQKQLIKESWEKLRPEAERAAELFYMRLFNEDPALRELFKGDISEQGERLMAMLGTAVEKLDGVEEMAPMIRDLGRRHAGFGVEPEHYESFCDALFWALHTVLGADFYPEVEEAWTTLFDFLVDTMKEGARDAA